MGSGNNDHRLLIAQVSLLGGDRSVSFSGGLNLITGPISTGKTTLIRLLEVALSVTPSDLPPETASVNALQASLELGEKRWGIYRPLVSTSDSIVSVAEMDNFTSDDPLEFAVSMPARGYEGSYSRFMLDRLKLPAVALPETGAGGVDRLNPVSMTDFLNYCVIRGEDLDSDVFGHDHPFRNNKRKFVFRLVYGLHDPRLSEIETDLRSVFRSIDALDTEAVTIDKFLAGTPFSGPEALAAELAARVQLLRELDNAEANLHPTSSTPAGEIAELRLRLLDLRESADRAIEAERDLGEQVRGLQELEKQLISQSARLTRAIVADEWLVDFDFMVCPRCGTDVVPVANADTCYLCHQVPVDHAGRDVLIVEQSRVATQVDETRQLIESRSAALFEAQSTRDRIKENLATASRDLDRATDRFVSDRASELQRLAARRSRLEVEIAKIQEYATLFDRRSERDSERARLKERARELEDEAERRRVRSEAAETRIRALEKRMLGYLERMHVPSLGDLLSVRINRTTFMPEVSGRTFDELSSQGLKTLVNVAHALAHHTVAIDLNLPLPGLLILDGISANSGHEGFDQARVEDVYQLLIDEAAKYADKLQLIVVDNTLPMYLFGDQPPVALVLSHEDRLIRTA